MHLKLLVAIAVLFFSATVSAQVPGDSIFNSGQLIHEVRITFPSNSWYDTLTRYYTVSEQLDSSVYLMATSVQFDGVTYDSVGCKFKGNSSYNNNSQKKSWKLDFEAFKPSNEINGLTQLNLNNGFKDPTLLREKICLDFLRYYGIAAPRADYVNVYVNNQLWGLYILVEEVDKTFVKTHFGNKSKNLFKGDPHGDFQYKGTQAANYYSSYELKTNEDVNDWSDLLWMIDNLHNTPVAEWRDSLDACFNTSSFIKSWATTILFSNLDSYTGSGHNFFIYHDAGSDKFEWINWDVNEAFGTFLNGNQQSQMTSLAMNYVPNPTAARPLTYKMSQDTVYWKAFKNFVCNALNDYFNPTVMDPIIDSLHSRIKNDAYADTKKFYPNSQFDANIDSNIAGSLGLKPFVTARYASLMQQLNGFACEEPITAIGEVNEQVKMSLWPNPVENIVQIYTEEIARQLCLFSMNGQLIQTIQPEGNVTRLQVEDLPAGCYYILAQFPSGQQGKKRMIKL